MKAVYRPLLKRIQVAMLPLGLSLLIGGVGGPLMLFPAFRLAEINENLPVKERSEELSHAGRFDQHRHLRLNQCALAVDFVVSCRPPLGHSQHLVLPAPSGHRLPNGLLAPLTC